jgi:hypothetical protein
MDTDATARDGPGDRSMLGDFETKVIQRSSNVISEDHRREENIWHLLETIRKHQKTI